MAVVVQLCAQSMTVVVWLAGLLYLVAVGFRLRRPDVVMVVVLVLTVAVVVVENRQHLKTSEQQVVVMDWQLLLFDSMVLKEEQLCLCCFHYCLSSVHMFASVDQLAAMFIGHWYQQ
jgi:hypothetical protein